MGAAKACAVVWQACVVVAPPRPDAVSRQDFDTDFTDIFTDELYIDGRSSAV